jgi:FkbM family methyltransferase
MLVNRNDCLMVETGGIGVGYQLLNNSSFDPKEVDVVLQLLETRRQNFGDGVVALDCGANLGVHTIEWARFMHGWGEVVAFEAQERLFYALAGNITLNNCFNAQARWAAIGATDGFINVPVPNYFLPSSFGSLEIKKSNNNEFIGQELDYSEAKSAKTPMVSIDGFNLSRLDFIKLDVEGMEIDALRGAEKSLRRFKPQLLIEVIKSDENEIREFVKALGYKVFRLGVNLLAMHSSDPPSEQIKDK